MDSSNHSDTPLHYILSCRFFEVLENATIDDEIGQVNATDADEGRNAELIYTETGSAFFEITTDGVLKVNRELDRETQDTDTFSVTVCDQGKPTVLCNTTTVNVTIKDVNEEPVFKYNQNGSIYKLPENSNCISISNLADFFADGDLGVNKELDFDIPNARSVHTHQTKHSVCIYYIRMLLLLTIFLFLIFYLVPMEKYSM